MRPLDLPPPSHWADRPHGTRLRYMAGCRCLVCRAANSRYETMRRRRRLTGYWNGLVDAREARAHIVQLGRSGMGYRAVAVAAGIASTVVQEVKSGAKLQIRAKTARAILAVKVARRPHALISAAETWRLLSRLIADGYPKRRLARMLGQRGQGLQMGRRRVTVRNAERVRKLYDWLTAEAKKTRAVA